jgi:hypothetical protein
MSDYNDFGPITPPDQTPEEPVSSGPLQTGPTIDPSSVGHLPNPGPGPLPPTPTNPQPHASADELGFDFTGRSGIVAPDSDIVPGEPTVEQPPHETDDQAGDDYPELQGL